MKEKINLETVRILPDSVKTSQDAYREYYRYFNTYDVPYKLPVAIKGLYLEANELLKNKKQVRYATKTKELLQNFVNAFGKIKKDNYDYLDFQYLLYEKVSPEQKELFEKGSNLICNAFDKRFKKLYQIEKKQTEGKQQKIETPEEKQQKSAVAELKKL